LEGVSYEELTYEGYGPGGVAFVLEILTDNKNRTAGDVRAIFTKGGGSMAASGAVAFQFDRKGIVPVKKGAGEDQVMELALDAGGTSVRHLAHGVLEVGAGGAIEDRLCALHEGLSRELLLHRPQIVALEDVFHAKNARSALVLGQARGVAILAAAQARVPVRSFAPSVIKQAVTGTGRAEKEQVGRMVAL